MVIFPGSKELVDALLAEGFDIPKECSHIDMGIPIDGVMQIHYTVNLMPEQMARLGRALVRVGLDYVGRSVT